MFDIQILVSTALAKLVIREYVAFSWSVASSNLLPWVTEGDTTCRARFWARTPKDGKC